MFNNDKIIMQRLVEAENKINNLQFIIEQLTRILYIRRVDWGEGTYLVPLIDNKREKE